MNREQISALMDGELEEARVQVLCVRMKTDESSEYWAAYHLIGDALRSECYAHRGFSKRFAERLAAEPTILAPAGTKPASGAGRSGLRSTVSARRWQYAMAASAMVAAVGLVGWFGMQEFQLGPGLHEMASTTSAVSPRALLPVTATSVQASRRTQAQGISPYLVVHQEYSPTTAMQGVRPYVRTVADMTPAVE